MLAVVFELSILHVIKLERRFLYEGLSSNESSYSTFERSLDSLGRENYIKDEYFKDRTVLVGSLRNKEQLQINLEGRFYHTKCKDINLAEHNIKFVALAQSKRQFTGEAGITYYGKIVDIKVVKRNKIIEILSNA